MTSVFAGIAADLERVAAVMRQQVVSQEPRINALIAALGDFHGKMLRPSLLILTARCLGPVGDREHRLGAALELIHTATLVHDDLIDEGEVRRGQTTAHVQFGNPVAVLPGDFFYTRAFDLVASLGDPVLTRIITATTNVICEGELHQMCAARDLGLTRAEYDRIIYAKTAVLCESACELGASAGTEAQRTAAAAFGRACGIAFQIVDDCLDLTGDPQKVGKTLSTDIERGRLTLPFLKVLDICRNGEREQLGQRFLAVCNADDVDALRALVVERGGVEAALDEARAQVAEARRHLATLPAGPERDQLDELAAFIVSRDR